MSSSYTQIKATLDEIAMRSGTSRKRFLNGIASIAAGRADLASMQTAYTSILTDLDAAAAANPNDPAWQAAKAEKDQMVADFLILKSYAVDLEAAIAGVAVP